MRQRAHEGEVLLDVKAGSFGSYSRRAYATGFVVSHAGKPKTWEEYTAGTGYSDEQRIVQPTAFPAFAEQCLGWTLQVNLAPEELGVDGKPDFTPADFVTHPFVFETKSTKEDGEQLRAVGGVDAGAVFAAQQFWFT